MVPVENQFVYICDSLGPMLAKVLEIDMANNMLILDVLSQQSTNGDWSRVPEVVMGPLDIPMHRLHYSAVHAKVIEFYDAKSFTEKFLVELL